LDPHNNGFVDAPKKEALHMPSPRWLARLAIPVLTGVALFSGAAIATADPVDDAYLAQLRGIGMTWPPDHDDALTGMGRLVCDDLGWGWTFEQITQNVHANLDPRNVGVGDVASMVSIAHRTYCPNIRCWAPHC